MLNMIPQANAAVTSRKATAEKFLHSLDKQDSVEELKYKLALANRIMAMEGLDEGGISGHISLKVPGTHDRFWVNPFGYLACEVTPENLIMVDQDGRVVEGNHPVNVAGFCIHSQIHEKNPDVECVVHTHSPWGTLFASLDREILPLDQNCCMFFENHVLFQSYGGPVIDLDEAEMLAEAMIDKNAVVLSNHGAITAGADIETAVMFMVAIERAFRLNVMASQLTNLKLVDPEVARDTREWIANPIGFRIEFEALTRKAERTYPDLLNYKPQSR